MNDHSDIERMLKDCLVPAPVPDALGRRLRRAWLGTAAARPDTPERQLRLRLHAWQWAFAAAATFAVILGVFRLYAPTDASRAVPLPLAATTPLAWVAAHGNTPPPPQPVPTPANQPDEVRQRILGADDLGLVGYPAANRTRQVRVRYLETQRWQDPVSGGWIERSQPQEATLLIPIRELRDDGSGAIQEGPIHIVRPAP